MSRIMIAALGVVAGGCSSYHAVKLDSTGPIPGGTRASAIVTLPRPEFVVKKVEGAEPVQYQVDVAYVPDPGQRYAVSMTSSPLASVDLDFVYAENGTLSSTGATVKDEAAPIMLGLFKAAASLAVATGTGGVAGFRKAPQSLEECFVPDDKPLHVANARCAVSFHRNHNACKAVAQELDARLQAYVAAADGTDKAPGLASLFARDQQESTCLAHVQAQINHLLTTPPARTADADAVSYVSKDMLEEVVKAFDADNQTGDTTPPAVRNAVISSLGPAIENADVGALKRIAYVSLSADVADPALAEMGLARFRTLLGGNVSPRLADAQRLVRVLSKRELFPDPKNQPTGLELLATIAEMNTVSKGLAAAQSLEPAVWRARYITAKQRELIQKERSLLAANPTVNVHEHKDTLALRREIASLAGVRSEFERALGFRKLLDRVPSKASTTDYEVYQKQLVALEQTINSAIAAAMTAESRQAAKVDKLPPRSPWVSADCIAQSRQEAWRYIRTSEAPRFVVVLRRADGTALAPRSNGSNECTL